MTLVWLAPFALGGIALVALPLAIHLLVRQQARRVAFPSLRFVRETQLAAFRARRLEDLWLLVVRAAIIAVAAMALAGPVLQTASRRAATAGRVSRATIEIDTTSDPRTAPELFRSKSFHRAHVGDAIADAVRWLNAQPSSSREIVFAGAMRRGALTDADLAQVPEDIGVRFDRQSASSSSTVTVPVLTIRDGRLVRVNRIAQLANDATRVSEGETTAVRSDLVRIAGKEQSLADAALRAALTVGVPWSDFETPVEIRLPDQTAIVDAADAVMRELQRVASVTMPDPVTIAPEQLEKWTRTPGAPSPDAPTVDEGDRRWLWALVLLLLGVEWWLRRRGASEAAPIEEARIA